MCIFFLRNLFSGVICLLLTQPAQVETNLILAEIGEQKITIKDLENWILRMQGGDTEEFTLEGEKEALLLELVRLELFAKEALALGLEKDKEVETRIRGFVNYILATEYLKREVHDKIDINEKEILQHFEENRFGYVEPEKIKARQIYIKVKTPEEINRARTKAKRLLERLKDGEDFASLAREFSDDPFTKDAGGDMGYFARGRLVPELEETVFLLDDDGGISPLLRSKSGFHIFKVEDRISGRPLEYDEVRERITEVLRVEKEKKTYKALEERLFKKYEIKIHKERIPLTP